MARFNRGDKVRRIIEDSYPLVAGQVYEVINPQSSPGHITVNGGGISGYMEERFELVTPASDPDWCRTAASREKQQRQAAADKLRAARDAFNAACSEAQDLELIFYVDGASNGKRVMLNGDVIAYRKVVEETL